MIKADKKNRDAAPPADKDKGRFITAFTDGSFCHDTSAYGCSYWIRDGENAPVTNSKGGIGIANCGQAEIEALNGAIDWINNNCHLAGRVVILQSDSLEALNKCNYYVLKRKAKFVKLKHVKAHSSARTKRSWVNNVCDKLAKDQMKGYRESVYQARKG
ncbi:MAG: hypothetical protein ABJG42_24360 [Vibrio splendidus]